LGYVYKRFSKTLPENAPTALEKKNRVNEIVAAIEVLFVDESHFPTNLM